MNANTIGGLAAPAVCTVARAALDAVCSAVHVLHASAAGLRVFLGVCR